MPQPSAPSRVLLLGTYTVGGLTPLAGVTASGTASQPIFRQADGSLTFFVIGIGTTSSGTVIIEEADWDPAQDQPYTGTWSAIRTVNASDVTGGAQEAVHITGPIAYGYIRARIGTVIGGGGSIAVVLRSW